MPGAHLAAGKSYRINLVGDLAQIVLYCDVRFLVPDTSHSTFRNSDSADKPAVNEAADSGKYFFIQRNVNAPSEMWILVSRVFYPAIYLWAKTPVRIGKI